MKFSAFLLLTSLLFNSTYWGNAHKALAAPEISDTKKRLFEGFSNDPRSVILLLQKKLEDLQANYEKLTSLWYGLHLTAEDNWMTPVAMWPDGQNFKEYILKSQTLSFTDPDSGQKEVGFLAFHRLPEYENTIDLYENAEDVSLATGIELLDDGENSPRPLANLQTQSFLSLYEHLNSALETITQVRLEIEILRDQVIALELSKDNGYYIRHLSEESKNALIQLPDELDGLLNKIKALRTNTVLPAYNHVLGIVYATNYAEYPTTTEFKQDIRLFVTQIKNGTPQLSAFNKEIQKPISQMKALQERNQLAQNYTKEQFTELESRVEGLFQELSDLAVKEHNIINAESANNMEMWSEWFKQNHSKYQELFYQLYEILEFTSEPGTDIYDFQMKVFSVNSVNRQLYRNLEALLFGTMNQKAPKRKIQKPIDPQPEDKAVLKFRSAIVYRIATLQAQEAGCNRALSF